MCNRGHTVRIAQRQVLVLEMSLLLISGFEKHLEKLFNLSIFIRQSQLKKEYDLEIWGPPKPGSTVSTDSIRKFFSPMLKLFTKSVHSSPFMAKLHLYCPSVQLKLVAIYNKTTREKTHYQALLHQRGMHLNYIYVVCPKLFFCKHLSLVVNK